MERALRDEKSNLGRGIEEAGLAAVLIEVGGRKRVGTRKLRQMAVEERLRIWRLGRRRMYRSIDLSVYRCIG